MAAVVSTYRLQLRGPEGQLVTFAEAEKLLDYLEKLGVTHLYLSPILTAVPGSSHGYDVTDPTTVSAELGGPEGLAELSAAVRARGMGLVVDIVPNHAGVQTPRHNPWWWDVLRFGRASAYADFFDIDWELDEGRILLPVLGSEGELDSLAHAGDTLVLGDLVLPIAPGTDVGSPADVLARQHYRLVDWPSGRCGYRRFLAINSLAALRQEDEQVFAATHQEIARWFAEDLIDGVRIDHLDGLSDPAGYLCRLRALLGPAAWIIVEKNLAAHEALDTALPVAGTTGYDALRLIGGLFIDPTGEPTLRALAAPSSVGPLVALRSATAANLHNDMQRLLRSMTTATGGDHRRLGEAVAAILGNIEVYRCDYPSTEAGLASAMAQANAARADLDAALGIVAAALAGGSEASVRLQQLSVAVTAGAIEGRLFHRDARLVSLNEFGGDPLRFGCHAAEFHTTMAHRARRWPCTMTALSTHDTLRGEDVRARIGVLSQLPERWATTVARWEAKAPCPDPATGLFLWQNIFGVWPADGTVTEALRERLGRYALKVVREAGICSRWTDPDTVFEQRLAHWLDAVLDGPVAGELAELVRAMLPHAHRDALAQKLLSLTVPGVPDIYQGTELWEDSLSDPDNRRPVDFATRRDAVTALSHPKMRIVHAGLQARREFPGTFLRGDYRPLLAAGPAAEHVVAFARGTDVAVAVSRWSVRLANTGWTDTVVPLSPGAWADRLTGRRWSGQASAAELFSELPAVLLVRQDR